jgi:DNA/RNA-binding domain of Phe-tRNA-synthetase-like protein
MLKNDIMELKFDVESGSSEKLKGLKVGYISFENCKIEKSNEQVDNLVNAASNSVKERFKTIDQLTEDLIIQGMRQLFYDIGLDPTKERPSGEALIRRIVKDKGIYRINTVVDINNVVSMTSAYPCGVYDSDKINGEITFLVGAAGQNYEGLGGREVNSENRLLTRDEESIFGGPTADSKRTSVTENTKSVLMLIYCPKNSEKAFLEKVIEKAKAMMSLTGATAKESGIYEIQ